MSSAVHKRLHITLIVLEAPPRWNSREYPHIGYRIFLETRIIGPHFVADTVHGSTFVEIFLLGSANFVEFCKSGVFQPFKVIQGH